MKSLIRGERLAYYYSRIIRTAWHIILAVNAELFELFQLFFARVLDVMMSHHIAAHNAADLRAKHTVSAAVQTWLEVSIRYISI